MYITEMHLSDGTVIASGADQATVITSTRLTHAVNSAMELTPGAVCAAMAQLRLITDGSVPLTAGMEVTLYRCHGGDRRKVGLFTLTQPTEPTAGTVELTLYDRMTWLDRAVAVQLPSTALELARQVCTQCGLTFADESMVNGGVTVREFAKNTTGRTLMGYLAQLAGGFCYADSEGLIRIGHYADRGVALTAADCFQNGIRRERYTCPAVDAVQLRRSDDSLYPETAQNGCILYNPLLEQLSAGLDAALANIAACLPGEYTPCRLSLPENHSIQPGDILHVTDRHGQTFKTLVMEKETAGGTDTLRCTGSAGRNSSSSVLCKTPAQLAQQAVRQQTQQEIFNKLTDYGAVQGFYLQDGKLYINAELVQILNLVAQVLRSQEGDSELVIDGGELRYLHGGKRTVALSNDAAGLPILYLYDYENGTMTHRGELTPHHIRLGGRETQGTVVLSVADGAVRLWLNGEDSKRLSWRANGDGTYCLVGS
ncbi:MAG: hypothetical protein IJB17_00735 [Oscillospiraceae bacterium]|nr:hypothetical protein [Oscillospiraceae bacterium]